jgi:hypothetical protein
MGSELIMIYFKKYEPTRKTNSPWDKGKEDCNGSDGDVVPKPPLRKITANLGATPKASAKPAATTRVLPMPVPVRRSVWQTQAEADEEEPAESIDDSDSDSDKGEEPMDQSTSTAAPVLSRGSQDRKNALYERLRAIDEASEQVRLNNIKMHKEAESRRLEAQADLEAQITAITDTLSGFKDSYTQSSAVFHQTLQEQQGELTDIKAQLANIVGLLTGSTQQRNAQPTQDVGGTYQSNWNANGWTWDNSYNSSNYWNNWGQNSNEEQTGGEEVSTSDFEDETLTERNSTGKSRRTASRSPRGHASQANATNEPY